MTKQRRKFAPSLKLEIVRMIKEQGLTITKASQSMDISDTGIRRWIKQYDAEQSGQRGIGNLSPSAFEQKMAAKKPIVVSEFT